MNLQHAMVLQLKCPQDPVTGNFSAGTGMQSMPCHSVL